MAKEPKPEPEKDEVTALVDAPQHERDEAHERSRECAQEIGVILRKHRCRIMPRIDLENIESVGLAGNKILIESSFWIAPLA